MNGKAVRMRDWPPYLTCLYCGGDGSNLKPYSLGCPGPHPSGWEIVQEKGEETHGR